MQPNYGDLVRNAAAGDESAWDELVAHLSGTIRTIARRNGLSESDVSDVCQTAWLRLFEHLDRIEDPNRVAAWLATTARHESARLRRRAGHHILMYDHGGMEPADPEQPHLDSGVLADERSAAVNAVYGHLPLRCQAILRLLAADPPLSYKELSAALEIAAGSIGPTRQRCLETLRRLVVSAEVIP